MKIFNYISKLEPKGKTEEGQNFKEVQKQLANSDAIQDELEYIYSVFSPLPVYICQLESQTKTVGEAAKIVEQFRSCLQMGKNHPLEAKYGTAEFALVRFESIIAERFTPLLQAAQKNSFYEKVPFSSIMVEADFSIIKHCLGYRKNFKGDNLSQYLEIVLHQKALAMAEWSKVSQL